MHQQRSSDTDGCLLEQSDEDVPEEDAAARRRADRDAQIKADLDNAANLLGTAKIAGEFAVEALELQP